MENEQGGQAPNDSPDAASQEPNPSNNTPTPPEPQQTQQESQKQEPQADSAKDDSLPDWVLQERKQLREEAAQWRVKLRETETTKDAEVNAVKQELSALQDKIARNEIVAKHGLPTEFAARLVGSSAEELEADAENLAKLYQRSSAGPRNLRGGLTPGVTPDTESAIDRARRVKRRY